LRAVEKLGYARGHWKVSSEGNRAAREAAHFLVSGPRLLAPARSRARLVSGAPGDVKGCGSLGVADPQGRLLFGEPGSEGRGVRGEGARLPALLRLSLSLSLRVSSAAGPWALGIIKDLSTVD